MVMVFNAAFNNISGISWLSVLLVKETRENNDLPQVTDKLLSKGWKAKKLRSLWNQEIQKT
jgi:hypothetical protein